MDDTDKDQSATETAISSAGNTLGGAAKTNKLQYVSVPNFLKRKSSNARFSHWRGMRPM
jgi:hypothetical protein